MKQKKIKIKTPAKINLSLEIIDKFPNGFHSISSVMQTVSLFDYLTFSLSETGKENQIILTGNSPKIPYDEKNIIYKVLKLYLDEIKANGIKIEVDIEKNIPTELLADAHHWLLLHGRYVCLARKPKCEECNLFQWCKKVGVK